MKDAMRAFSEISALVSVPIVLMFNKFDILKKCLGIYSFRHYFPDYTGSEVATEICKYLAVQFRRLDLRPDGILQVAVVNAANPDGFQNFLMSTGIFTVPLEGSSS